MEYIEDLLKSDEGLQLRHRSYQAELPEERYCVVLLLDGGCTAGSEYATLEEARAEYIRTRDGDKEGGMK